MEDIGVFTGIPAGTAGAEFFYKVGPFSKPCIVFRTMARRFGGVIIQKEEHFVAHLLLIINFRILKDSLFKKRVGVFALPAVIKIKCLMVDAGAGVADVVIFGADPSGQHLGRTLYRMTEAADGQPGKN